MKEITKKILLFSLVFLVGCSSTTFIYNRIDFLLPWYLESYVDLNQEQRKNLNELLEPFFEWHREEELPKYAEIIGDLELFLMKKLSSPLLNLLLMMLNKLGFELKMK